MEKKYVAVNKRTGLLEAKEFDYELQNREQPQLAQVGRQEPQHGGLPGVLGGGDHPLGLMEHEVSIALRFRTVKKL